MDTEWIAMMKMIIFGDAQYGVMKSFGWHNIGLKVVLRTISFNLSRVLFNAHPRSRGIVLRAGYASGIFMKF